ncbi:MAG TPA: Mut7-C RNAse domain-containing protein [Candidatus Aminicenantes bacterium]|nr:Mut7-C RNAse domain-containing protein [Candidatus Aminicenantes bacterium]HRY63939.1 Mut7-C RNAse domain-containing protein [Candidatus Aminicenantes bacterium]HRZ70852.1 Mut7-C RNAse domain-containing protein [Candidatus Aminicenantes bacterium]
MTFVADCMLGRLAKWLRILGFDAAYFPKAEDPDLVALARREGRVLLTRDTGLIERTARRPDRLFVRSDDWQDQVVQVLDEYGLWDEIRPNTRCLACNLPLKPLGREPARNLVSPYIGERAASFAVCAGCGRVFWPGTHAGDMELKIDQLRARRGRPRN